MTDIKNLMILTFFIGNIFFRVERELLTDIPIIVIINYGEMQTKYKQIFE